MIKSVKKHNFILPFARLFTRSEGDAYDSICFQNSDSFGDEQSPALAAPTNWSAEAVSLIADGAACPAVPADIYATEENTVPSWLWRHQSRPASRREAEGDVRQIFDRAVGSAAAKAWKLGLFSSEKHARSFYDEARYALMQRQIAFAPEVVRDWGLSWAYGIQPTPKTIHQPSAPKTFALSNAALDAQAVKGKTSAPTLWKKLFTTHGKEETLVSLRLSDIAEDWYSATQTPARAAIDLLALRHNDGGINIDALCHVARLTTILLDLQDSDATITLANLAPLLLALGLAYDSEAGRALAASLAALVTAECYAASAEMAGLRGASTTFTADREAITRSLRNHRRAAYGDANDYEKVSVLPAALSLKNCPDLALAAEAQHRWDDVLARVRTFGLRATHVTDLTPSPVLAMLMQSASQGLEPLRELTILTPDSSDVYRTELHPVAIEALARLAYPRNTAAAIAQHITGTRSLRKTPVINAATLRARGIDASAFEKIESYLPNVNSICLAVTPWIIGVDYCRTVLKIPARLLETARFDLLKHIGFSDEDVAAANAACYGFGTVRNAKTLNLRHRPLFARGDEISNEARIRMAASVQSFVSGDTGLVASLPVADSTTRGADVTLSAWRRGLKSLTIVFDPALAAPPVRKARVTARRISPSSHAHAKPMSAAGHTVRGKKSTHMSAARKNAERRTRSA